MNEIYSKIVVIGNTDDVNSIMSKLSSVSKIFRIGNYSYELLEPSKIETVPENCQPSIQGKSYISFEVSGNAVFDCETFLQDVHYDQFCIYSENESNMGLTTIWSKIPEKNIDQWFEKSDDPMHGPVGYIRSKGTKKWRKPSVTEVLILYPLTQII